MGPYRFITESKQENLNRAPSPDVNKKWVQIKYSPLDRTGFSLYFLISKSYDKHGGLRIEVIVGIFSSNAN